ncbi:MAG: sugar transferase, partial [Rhizomicrobium sp.]
MSIQEHSLPAPRPAFPASDDIAAAPAAAPAISIKRVLDIVLSLVALLLFLPVLAIIALAIVWDSGEPVFFHQRRIGQYAKVFNIYKFRTMHVLEDGA